MEDKRIRIIFSGGLIVGLLLGSVMGFIFVSLYDKHIKRMKEFDNNITDLGILIIEDTTLLHYGMCEIDRKVNFFRLLRRLNIKVVYLKKGIYYFNYEGISFKYNRFLWWW